jgi:hexosaminidase
MNHTLKSLSLIIIFALLSCGTSQIKKDSLVSANSSKNNCGEVNIIPYPNSMKVGKQTQRFDNLAIYIDTVKITEYMRTLIKNIEARLSNDSRNANIIVKVEPMMPPEAYKIDINSSRISITVSNSHGLQYALESLGMLRCDGNFPIVSIEDEPKFAYRGMHLDVCRHFFSVDEVKKYIDYLARYKYNRFHWHLTEDQGWRIEIKRYPKLTEIGGYRKETLIGHYNDQPQKYDGLKHGGFYTQEQVKEIVKYASARHITIIPEIEMPGHALAALAAYPQLGCSGGPYEVATKWGVFDDVFCPTEQTFTFLQNVLDEVISLFPSQHIHIGGDECPKESWKKSTFCQRLITQNELKDEYELQAYFIRHIATYIKERHGRTIIGWDEILEGDLTSSKDGHSSISNEKHRPVIMSWRGTEGGIAAAKANHFAIMTPGSHCYFDHYQSQKPSEPVAIGGYTDINKVYGWDPIPAELNLDQRKYIIGGQANLWTEYIPKYSHLEYMAFARGLAMSEALWGTNKDYNGFIPRFEFQHDILKSKGINIANHIYELKPNLTAGKGSKPTIKFELPKDKKLIISIDGKTTGDMMSNDIYTFSKKGSYNFSIADLPQEIYSVDYTPHLATLAKISISPSPADNYKGEGPGSIINGITGSDHKYGGSEWLGFEGKDANITLNYHKAITVKSLKMKFFKGEGQWIYLPKKITIKAISETGSTIEKVISSLEVDGKTGRFTSDFGGQKVKTISIVVENYGIIPDGFQGAGHGAWLFVDEVIVE